MAAMKQLLRPLTALVMALTLLLMGQGAASARGLSGPDGGIVICTGTGPVMIFMDADGAPAPPPHVCPDCALSLIQSGHDAALTLRVPEGASSAKCFVPGDSAEDKNPVTAQARGPPRTG